MGDEYYAVYYFVNYHLKICFGKLNIKKMLKNFILNYCKIEEGIWIIQNHKNLLCNILFNYQEFLNNELQKCNVY